MLANKEQESEMLKSGKIFTGAVAAAVIIGSVAAATPASAYYWRPYGYGYGWAPYAGAAAGALALGVIAGAAAAQANLCYYESRPVYRRGYFVGYRDVPVC
jgi:hypothetical protein